MELVYVTVIGAGIGLLLRYLLPGRTVYGVLLLPAVAAAVTAAVWVGLVWLGVTFDSPWIWVASLGGAAVVSAVVAVVLSRRRIAWDARQRHVLSGGRA
jgi:hypothetical protein